MTISWFFIIIFVLLSIFLAIAEWTMFVRRYHDVGLSGQFFWFNILANVFMQLGDKIPNNSHIVFDVLGIALCIMCYVIASLPSKKFKNYTPKKR